MSSDEEYDLPMLTEALAKARRLVEGLEKLQADKGTNPPDLPPEKLAEGKMALDNALASARRALKALDEAYEIALLELQDNDEQSHVNN